MLLKAHPLRDPALRERVTQGFGEHPEWYARFSYDGVPLKGHNGIDFGVPSGSQVQAVDDGSVLENTFDPNGFGYYFRLRHDWGESLYAHLTQPAAGALTTGQPVRAGQALALSDNTGFSTGPHLHFGIRINPYRRDDGWGGFSDPAPCLAELAQANAVPDLDAIRLNAWNTWGIPYSADSALSQYARTNSLGAPLTREFTVGAFRCQAFVLGIAYAPVGQWDQVKHIAW